MTISRQEEPARAMTTAHHTEPQYYELFYKLE